MKNLEQLISRYLDQELTLQEEEALRHLLDSSAEARETLQQMEALRVIARRLPGLTQPSIAVENELFQKLFIEESEEVEETNRRPVPSPLLYRIADIARRRVGTLVPALTLLVAVGVSLWAFIANTNSDGPQIAAVTENIGTSNPIASSIAPITSSSQTVRPSEHPESLTETVNAASSATSVSIAQHSAYTNHVQPENFHPNSSAENIDVSSNDDTHINTATAQSNLAAVSTPQETDVRSAEAQWPPVQLLESQEKRAEDNSTALARNKTSENETSVSEEIIFASRDSDTDAERNFYAYHQEPKNAIAASYRHGLSYIQGDSKEFSAQDFSIRVEGRFQERHRISLALGQSPLLIERTTTTLPTGIAADPDKQGPTIASERIEYSSRLIDEVWAGIGYGFAVVSSKSIRIEPGLSFGVGEESIRFGAELPIRYRLNNRFSIDLVASMSRVEPHDISQQDVDREYDQTFFLHVDEEERAAFTSLGAHIGLSIDIGR